MSDYFDKLKEIKKDLQKEKDELNISKEGIKEREIRLKREFKEYAKALELKKI